MLASPRVFFAMAEDRLLFQGIASVHSRYRTPYVAILVAAVLGMALVMSRSFERLTDTFVLAIWPFYALGVAAIYRLRRERPELPRPYRALGYPVVPAVFIASVRGQRAHQRHDEQRYHFRTDPGGTSGLPVLLFIARVASLTSTPIFLRPMWWIFFDASECACYSFFFDRYLI